MKLIRSKPIALVAAAALLVVGLDAATYAGTGDSLLLGKVNKANKPTQVRNTGAGPALRLRTRAGAPPLAVTSTRRVARLNVDRVDGRHAADLLNQVVVLRDDDLTTVHTGVTSWPLTGVEAGRYLISYTAVLDQSANPFEAICGVTSTFEDITAAGHMLSSTFIDTWLSGTGIRTIDPAADFFFCQSLSGTWTLKNPLEIVLTPVAEEETLPIGTGAPPRPARGGVR